MRKKSSLWGKGLWLALLACGIWPQAARAQELALGAPFSDYLVVQRGKPIPVWGRAEPGATVMVSFGSSVIQTAAGADGTWRIDLPAHDAADAMTMEVRSGGEILSLANIAVGDVFLCSGQSNMEFSMSETALPANERKAPIDSQLRLFKAPLAISHHPLDKFSREAIWRPGQTDTATFSSVCLLFGRAIASSEGVVVGLVNSSFGGTPIESWMSREAMVRAGGMDQWITMLDSYAADPAAAEIRYGNELARYWSRTNSPFRSRMGFANIHNAMIAPLGPTRFAGALWYQGENNANGSDTRQAYASKLHGLIDGWRTQFGAGLPVIIIQLAGFGPLSKEAGPSDWAEIREAQRQVALADPLTELVVTIDVGERLDIHPPLKKPVAMRAAQAARSLIYGEPLPVGLHAMAAFVSGGEVVVTFAAGAPGMLAASWGRPGPFQLCSEKGLDCTYADAAFGEGDVRIAIPDRMFPALVRYCWAAAPICNVFDDAQQPLGPFELPVQREPPSRSFRQGL